jgi:dipeptidyl aminopeptidase/acylaminoacyl peptidase
LGPTLAIWALAATATAETRRLESADYVRMRSVDSVRLSPDGARVAYTVVTQDQPGRPQRQLFVMTVADGRSVRLGGSEPASAPEWSPDGRLVAFKGTVKGRKSLAVSRPDGSGLRFLAEMTGTNSPLTFEGRGIAWSPDSKWIAYVSTTPGPETELTGGDPVVITRYLYKPDAEEGLTRFNDNRRRHVFMVDVEGGPPRQLTTGDFEEHSIDFSPDGREIAFVSNREADPDLFYNPDLFVLRVEDGSIRRLTATESAEFQPRWSPDGKSIVFLGTRRGLTDLETTMEDTHVWIMAADGTGRRELGRGVDNRQQSPAWLADGSGVYCTVQERGQVRLYRLPLEGKPEVVVGEDGRIGDFSVGRDGTIAYAFAGRSDLAQLYLRTGAPRRLTDLNAEVLKGVEIAPVESFTFLSNDFKYEVEAFLTKPIGLREGVKHPLIVMIHGGPH